MPNFASLKAYGDELGKLQKAFDSAEKRKITKAQAEKAQKIVERFVERDLGADRAFPNWKRGDRIAADTQIKAAKNDGHLLLPTRAGAGILTTVNQGRNQGNARGFAGPGVNRRTGLTSRTKSGGLRKVRATKGRRWNGTTQPKHTVDEAVVQMERDLPKLADDGYRRVLRKHFDVTGG